MLSTRRNIILILIVVALLTASTAAAVIFEPLNAFLHPDALSAEAPQTQPLGEVIVESGPTPCGPDVCYTMRVRCDQLAKSQSALVKVGAPTGSSAPRGTIVFASGWIGDYWWDDGAPNNLTIINELHAAGFQTVQMNWPENWFLGEDRTEGFGKLACRPATLIQWVYDKLHHDKLHENNSPLGKLRDDNLKMTVAAHAFCAVGHSNGASQVAYSLVRYGLADILDMVLFTSGPNWSRIDQSCIQDAAHPQLFGDEEERNSVDWAFGFPNDGSGPCTRSDARWAKILQRASLIETGWSYSFPNTMIAFAFGGSDTTVTANQGRDFYQQLYEAGTPLLSISTIPAAPHFMTEVAARAEFIKTQLLEGCHVR